MRVKLLIMLAFVMFLPLSPQLAALALADVELQSHLNQQLSARIRLLEVSEGVVESLSISVREISDVTAAGTHMDLSHEVVADGANYYLMIRSRDTIREPILRFVVELNWSAGHLLRNYALIIDPQ